MYIGNPVHFCENIRRWEACKELGIKQVDEIVERMGITDEDLDNLTSEMNQLIQPEDDEDDIGSRTRRRASARDGCRNVRLQG